MLVATTARIRAVLWDVDGTLVDTAEQHFAAWQRLAESIGRTYTRADFAATFGWRNPEIFRHLFDATMPDDRVAELAFRKEEFYRDSVRTSGTQLLPGVARWIREFQAAGYLQALGSSAPRGNLDLLLEVTGVRSAFGAIVSGDDVIRGKPDPEVFLKAANLLGVAPQDCVVMEDAIAGVEAARAAGMRCVGVTYVGHHSAEKLKAAGAALIIESFEQLSWDQLGAMG